MSCLVSRLESAKLEGTAQITDPLPQDLAGRFGQVVAALDAAIPAKQLDRNLLLGSWNIRGFGDVTEKWRSEENDSPKRDLFDVRCIAEIVSRFDVVAIQEARGDLSALRAMLQTLGEDWALIATDVTRGRAGNNERMLFVFDRRRIRPSGLAGELVVALEEDTPVEATGLDKQFARTPYAVSFEAGSRAFTLVTLHVIYGDAPADRVDELKEIATWLAEWPKREKEWSENLLTLGDFNIDRRGDPLWEALTSTGLKTPQALNDVPRTIFDDPQDHHFYDQIAWFEENGTKSILTLDFMTAGSFDFVPLLQGGLTTTALSWRISDHYPLWVELSVREAN
jgi:endonuclease/exonuclease/phosphatase family metal-dependent hydrolase